MKKKFLCTVVCSVALAAALCGCGDKKDDTTAATTAASVTEASADTEAADTEAQSAATGLAAASKVVLNGVTFGVGEKASDVVAKLGDQIKPSEKSQPCIPGAGEITHYYYAGLCIDASQYDVISSIHFTNDFGEGYDAKTVNGAGLGSTVDEIKAAFGTPETEDEYGLSFKDGDLNVSVIIKDDQTAMTINIEDMSVEL